MRTPAPLPPSSDPTHLLEVNLISAQGLKPPTTTLRKLQTYAVAYIDPSLKLRTRTDRVGGENPSWNDKFIFRVSAAFLSGDTSAVTVDIFAVGVLRDHLLGTVRLVLSSFLSKENFLSPQFAASHIRRPSGRFNGVLNVGAMVIDGAGIDSLSKISAIGYKDMMGGAPEERPRRHRRGKGHQRGVSGGSSGGESWELSDGSESTASNCSSSSSSTVLKEMNWEREERETSMGGRKGSGEILCGLGFPRKIHTSLSDQDIQALAAVDLNKSV